jgi:hypothetical protein
MDKNLLASVLVDEALASSMMPWACPCDFGPEGRYRLLELVGAGRASLVYRAQDRSMSSEGFSADVAVKIVRAGGAEREALAGRRVTHPNVLRVLDKGVDTASGAAFMVMEFADGGDLGQQKLPWPVPKAVEFVAKLARALQAAHEAGVVHCDLKPDNILLTRSGEPKIGDFGLALSVLNPERGARGNIAFMSPEQFLQEEDCLAPPADIYALGGLLYYLITGELPNGSTHDEVAAMHNSRGELPRRKIRGDVGGIIERSLLHDRGRRHHSAGELAEDLERILRHEPIPWLKPGPLKRTGMWAYRHPFTAAALLVGVVLGISFTVQYVHAKDSELRRQAEAHAEAQRLWDEEKAAVRQEIKTLVQIVNAKNLGGASSADRYDRLLPMLVWLEFISNWKILEPDGRLAGAIERLQLLDREYQQMLRTGRGEHFDALMSRYALAHYMISLGQHERPRVLLEELEQMLLPKLAPDDPLHLAVAAMKRCAEAMEAPNDPVRLQALREVEQTLAKRKTTQSVHRLVQRVIARIEDPSPDSASVPASIRN